LTRPVVPPDGSFVFACISGSAFGEISRGPRSCGRPQLRNPAMPGRRLTVDREENAGFLRIPVGTGV